MAAGEHSVRLTHISHYASLENKEMCDRETSKVFLLNKDTTTMTINGHKISPDSLTWHSSFEFLTPNCYCLCLSNSKDSEFLYDRFKADTCLEIDVTRLVEIIEDCILTNFPGTKVLHKDIIYYPDVMQTPFPMGNELIFQKPQSFQPEDEYRVALIIPASKRDFQTGCGKRVPAMPGEDAGCTYLNFTSKIPGVLKSYIRAVHRRRV